jgi:pimeloyl-ACP methyl ester carboxylesterase
VLQESILFEEIAALSLANAAPVAFKTAGVACPRVFYREAGDPSKPTIVLLLGFPSSSHEFNDLIGLQRPDRNGIVTAPRRADRRP